MLFTGMLLSIAIVYDWKYYRIPNWLIGIGLAAGFCYQIIVNGSHGVLSFLTGAFVCFLIMFPFSMLRMFGAGDVKLLMVIGSFFGVSFTIKFLVVAFIIGAAISLGKMLKHQNLGVRLQYLANYFYVICTTKRLVKYEQGTLQQQEESVIRFSIPMGLAFIYMLVRNKYFA